MSERGCFTIAEFAEWARIGKTKVYELIAAGDLPVVKLGNKTLVRRADAEALIERYLVVKPVPTEAA